MLVTETLGRRVYLCAFESAEGHSWLALGDDAQPLTERRLVREAASLAALCEVAEESAGGGDLTELRSRLAELRATDNPEGIEEAEAAAAFLADTLAARAAPGERRLSRRDRLGFAAARADARRERLVTVRRGDAVCDGRGRGAQRRRRAELQAAVDVAVTATLAAWKAAASDSPSAAIPRI